MTHHLTPEDLDENAAILTIKCVEQERVGADLKGVLYFEELRRKGLVLDERLTRELIDVIGTECLDAWIGVTLLLRVNDESRAIRVEDLPDTIKWRYEWELLATLPETIPAGRVLVHNPLRPLTRQLGYPGVCGWLCAPNPKDLEICPCGWASTLGTHFRMKGTLDAQLSRLARRRNRTTTEPTR
jgi:hypothetical protein